MPSMYSEPCAKLTMRVTPKINDSPAATKNNEDASASPLRNWTRKPVRDMGATPCGNQRTCPISADPPTRDAIAAPAHHRAERRHHRHNGRPPSRLDHHGSPGGRHKPPWWTDYPGRDNERGRTES